MTNPKAPKLQIGIVPLLVTPRNCEGALGCSWDTLQRCRVRLGLPLLKLGAHTPAVEAASLILALQSEASAPAPSETATVADPAAAARKALGLRRKDGR